MASRDINEVLRDVGTLRAEVVLLSYYEYMKALRIGAYGAEQLELDLTVGNQGGGRDEQA